MTLAIGSRGSSLALWQAEWVRAELARAGAAAEIKVIKTSGDRFDSAPLASSGKGVFVKEIEEALLASEIDLAVHSLKDLPSDQPAGLVIEAIPERADARDALVSRHGEKFLELPKGARIGTGSPRRRAQLKSVRPDLEFVSLRGNVETRIAKMDRGECDAIALAAAGLARLNLLSQVAEFFPASVLCPAPGQGALAVECRQDNEAVAKLLAPLDHPATRQAVTAERALLRRLGGGCRVPIAAWARIESESLLLTGVVSSPDGKHILRSEASAPHDEADSLGIRVAEDLLSRGAESLLR